MTERVIWVVGWIILIAYLWFVPLRFEVMWVLVYVAILVSVALLSVRFKSHLIDLLNRRASATTSQDSLQKSSFFRVQNPESLLRAVARRPLAHLLLAPGEDGFFFVPLVLIGVTWYSAIPFALLFGLAHYKEYSPYECGAKAIHTYLNCLIVLPHGILHFVVGHLAVNGILFYAAANQARESSAKRAPQGFKRYVMIPGNVWLWIVVALVIFFTVLTILYS